MTNQFPTTVDPHHSPNRWIKIHDRADLIWNEDRVRRKAMPKDALTPQARYHFTRFDQVDQLVSVPAKRTPDLGFMARLMALCSPAPHQSRRSEFEYKRVNGPYTALHARQAAAEQAPLWQPPPLVAGLALNRSGADPKPRVGSREVRYRISCERSASGATAAASPGELTRLRNQMKRLFRSSSCRNWSTRMSAAKPA